MKINSQPAHDNSTSRDSALADLRVLIVDDDDDTRELLKLALTRHGAEVLSVETAIEALKMLEQTKFDVLLSDIGMPEIDGYELIHQVRAREAQHQAKAIPAAALTAYARQEDQLRILAAGFQMHIPKPVELAELKNIVAQLAGRKSKDE